MSIKKQIVSKISRERIISTFGKQDNILYFELKGDGVYGSGVKTLHGIRFKSSTANNVYIKYEEDEEIQYSLPANVITTIPPHFFNDPTPNTIKVVRVRFDNIKTITEFELNTFLSDRLPDNIINLENLERFYIVGNGMSGNPTEFKLEEFPFAMLGLKNLRRIEGQRSVKTTSSGYGAIPLPFFDLPLTTFSWGYLGLDNNFLNNNIHLIRTWAPSLERLLFTGSNLLSALPGPDDVYPEGHELEGQSYGFQLLENTNHLDLRHCGFSEVPPVTALMPSLNDVPLYANPLTSLEGFGNIPLLNRLYLGGGGSQVTPVVFPPNWSNLTKLRRIEFIFSINDQSRFDVLVNSTYELITNNAPITGTNVMPFRGLVLHYSSGNTAMPSGIFQQPAGYVQGSSNGTPASAMEQLWVLQNQYQCQVNLPA